MFTGIQLADELGFKESLSSLEQNSKRRSVNGFLAPGSFEPLAVPQNNNNQAVSIILLYATPLTCPTSVQIKYFYIHLYCIDSGGYYELTFINTERL